MGTIRLAVIEQMKKQFDRTIFSRHMFDVKVDERDAILKIEFQGGRDYKFILQELSSIRQNRYKFMTIESPGQIANEPEEFFHENLGNANSRVYQWANRIEEDYQMAVPEDSELESFRKEIFEKLKVNNSDDSYFSDSERTRVSGRMDDLERKMESFYEEKKATQQQIDAMREQIRILKQSVEILDKRTWVSAAFNRVFDIYKEVKAAKQEVSALLGDISMLLPDNSENNDGD